MWPAANCLQEMRQLQLREVEAAADPSSAATSAAAFDGGTTSPRCKDSPAMLTAQGYRTQRYVQVQHNAGLDLCQQVGRCCCGVALLGDAAGCLMLTAGLQSTLYSSSSSAGALLAACRLRLPCCVQSPPSHQDTSPPASLRSGYACSLSLLRCLPCSCCAN
jgi:hypothetical protein